MRIISSHAENELDIYERIQRGMQQSLASTFAIYRGIYWTVNDGLWGAFHGKEEISVSFASAGMNLCTLLNDIFM